MFATIRLSSVLEVDLSPPGKLLEPEP